MTDHKQETVDRVAFQEVYLALVEASHAISTASWETDGESEEFRNLGDEILAVLSKHNELARATHPPAPVSVWDAAYKRGVEDCIRVVKEGAWPEDGTYGPEDAAIQTAERATVDFAVEEMRALLPQKDKAND